MHQAVLTFTLPRLAESQPLGQTYTFSTFDPSYYVDMHWRLCQRYHDAGTAARGEAGFRFILPRPAKRETLRFAQRSDTGGRRRRIWDLGKQFAQTVTLQQCQVIFLNALRRRAGSRQAIGVAPAANAGWRSVIWVARRR